MDLLGRYGQHRLPILKHSPDFGGEGFELVLESRGELVYNLLIVLSCLISGSWASVEFLFLLGFDSIVKNINITLNIK